MKVLAAIVMSIVMLPAAFAQDDKTAAAQSAVEKRDYAQAVALIGEPQSSGERYWLGRALVELKRYDEADAQFRQVQEANDSDPNAYEGLGRSALARKDYKGALENANHAIELNAESADAHYVRGVALAYTQDYNNAAASLQKSLQLNPDNGYSYYQLGLVQYRQKRYDQTIRNFQKFIELEPNAPEAPQVKSILKTLKG